MNQKVTIATAMPTQVLIRLILSGMYPIYGKVGAWIYFKNEKGEFIGTPKRADFETYWQYTIYLLGEGQMSDEERTEVRQVDYLLTDEYKEHFKQWSEKVFAGQYTK